jgi:hypothetical protein
MFAPRIAVNCSLEVCKMRRSYKATFDPASKFRPRPRIARTRRRISSVVVTATSLLVVVGCAAATFGWVPGFDLFLQGFRSPSYREQMKREVQAGSILFTSPNVDTCREQLFDNSTGRQRDNGIVDCKSAIYRVKQNEMAARMNAITDGFRQK